MPWPSGSRRRAASCRCWRSGSPRPGESEPSPAAFVSWQRIDLWASDGCVGKTLGDHLVGVGAEAGSGEDAVELGAHEALPRRVVAPPLPQRLHEARREGRGAGIERENLVGEKGIAITAPIMEMQRVTLAEGADQGAHPVRV